MVEQFSLCIIVSDNTHSKQHHPSGSFVVGEFFLQTLLILYSKKRHTPFWVVSCKWKKMLPTHHAT